MNLRLANHLDRVAGESLRLAAEFTMPGDKVFPLLQTLDGTVGAMLRREASMSNEGPVAARTLPTPDWLQQWWEHSATEVRGRHPSITDVRQLPWEALPKEYQRALMAHAAIHDLDLPLSPGAPVLDSYQYHWGLGTRDAGLMNLRFNGKIDIQLPEARRLFGRNLPRGTSRVDLSEWCPTGIFPRLTDYRMHVTEPMTTLLGETVETGNQHLLVAVVSAQTPVEHASGTELLKLLREQKLGNLQLHLRSGAGKMAPSEMIESVWAIADSLGVPRPLMHLHLVSALPLDVLLNGTPSQRIVHMASFVEFVLRAQSLEEYRTVLEGETLREKRGTESHATIWAFFQSARIAELIKRFLLLGVDWRDPWNRLGDHFKGAAVGVHWSVGDFEKYDERGVVGLHVRTIDPASRPQTTFAVVDSLQSRLGLYDYVVPIERLSRWTGARIARLDAMASLPRFVIEKFERTYALARWHQPFSSLVEHATDAIRAEIDAPFLAWLEHLTAFRADTEDPSHEIAPYLEVKLLLHNYAHELLFFDDERALARIDAAQLKALRRLKAMSRNDEDPALIRPLVQRFLRESGVWERTIQSMKLKEEAATGRPMLLPGPSTTQTPG